MANVHRTLAHQHPFGLALSFYTGQAATKQAQRQDIMLSGCGCDGLLISWGARTILLATTILICLGTVTGAGANVETAYMNSLYSASDRKAAPLQPGPKYGHTA